MIVIHIIVWLTFRWPISMFKREYIAAQKLLLSLIHVNRDVIIVINVWSEYKMVFRLLDVTCTSCGCLPLIFIRIKVSLCSDDTKSNCNWLKREGIISFYNKTNAWQTLFKALIHCEVIILWKMPSLNFSWLLFTTKQFLSGKKCFSGKLDNKKVTFSLHNKRS